MNKSLHPKRLSRPYIPIRPSHLRSISVALYRYNHLPIIEIAKTVYEAKHFKTCDYPGLTSKYVAAAPHLTDETKRSVRAPRI